MKSLLIRAEDKNIWERRTPIVPNDLRKLVSAYDIQAYVQRSDKRFFKEKDYLAAGAKICDDMNPGDIILGIKEIPVHKLLDNKVYFFFSHTTKGQVFNMSMLKKIIDGGSTLIDYEKITDSDNRRLIYFGRYAGDVGAIDILWLLGEYWNSGGISTPFTNLKQATNYNSVKEAQIKLKQIGEEIKTYGLSHEICPLIIGILGYGNVSAGAQQIFECLPIERIEPENLKSLIEHKQWNQNTVYLSVFKEQHMVKNKYQKPFELEEYFHFPERYVSQFDKYLQYLTVLVNAVYWDNRFPRFVTWESLKALNNGKSNRKLCGIADISCDVNGSIECNVKVTNTGMPAYLCDPFSQSITDGYKGEGIILLAVDNLPAEVPNDSSTFFSNQLKQFIPNILTATYHTSLENSGLCEEVRKAVIVYNGALTPAYEYLKEYLKQS